MEELIKNGVLSDGTKIVFYKKFIENGFEVGWRATINDKRYGSKIKFPTGILENQQDEYDERWIKKHITVLYQNAEETLEVLKKQNDNKGI